MDFTFSGFISGAMFVALLAAVLNSYWEHRKLSRDERASAYAHFLSVFSKRWRAFSDRDGADKRGGRETDQYKELDARVDALRDDLYEAYTRIEILAPHKVVALALYCLGVSDARNRQHTTGGGTRGVGVDERAEALRSFIAAARRDVGQNQLKLSDLREKSRLAKNGVQTVEQVLIPQE